MSQGVPRAPEVPLRGGAVVVAACPEAREPLQEAVRSSTAEAATSVAIEGGNRLCCRLAAPCQAHCRCAAICPALRSHRRGDTPRAARTALMIRVITYSPSCRLLIHT